MPLKVPESLFEYKLNESEEDVKAILQDMDPDMSSENEIYEILIDNFKEIPEEYLEKFIEWALSPTMLDSTREISAKLAKAYSISKDKGIIPDLDLAKFKSPDDYFKELINLIQEKELVKTDISIKYNKDKKQPPKEQDIKNKKTGKTLEKSNDNTDYDEIAEEDNSIIKTVPLQKPRNGFECDIRIRTSDALNVSGQGIYIWTNKSYLEAGKSYYKVGQYGSPEGRYVDPKTPDETISSYAGTTIDKIVILYAIKLDDYLKSDLNKTHKRNFRTAKDVEKRVHDIIKNKTKGGYQVHDRGKSTELFSGVSLKEIIEIINDVLTGVKKLANYSMREEQKKAVEKMKDNYNSGKREFLLAAKMRFGKNFTLLNTAKDLGFKNILVLTYKPHVFESLKEDIENHVNFDGWEPIDFKKERNKIKAAKPNENPKVFMSSAQLIQYKNFKAEDDETMELENASISDMWDNLPALKKISWDMIIADEYHYGASTNNFNEILKQLKQKGNPYIIKVSGTAMKDIAMGTYDDDQIFEWSYLDEQEQKNLEKSGKSKSKQHIDMPTMEMHLIDIDPEVINEVESKYDVEEGGEGFTMKKLISTKSKNGPLKYPGALQKLLDQIIEGHGEMSPYKFAKDLEHTLWVLPKWVSGIKAMAELMNKKDSYFQKEGYKILTATGSGKDVIQDINDVKRAIKANPKTITLTCYRFKEGVSIPKWNGVFMLDDGKSVEEYLQAIFRVQNPDPENNKEKCYVFDFNPQRGLSMVYEICENDKKGKKTNVEGVFNEFNKYADILHHTENSLVKVDFNQVMEAFKTQTNWREKFANIKNINISHIDDAALKILSGIKSGKRGFKTEINDNDVTVGKNLVEKSRAGGKGKKLSKDEIKEALKRLITVLSNIPEYLFNTGCQERRIEDLFECGEPDIFKKITGIELEEFERWVDMGLINPVLMTRNILSFNVAETELMSHLSGKKLEDFTKKNFQLRAEEGKTPLPLVKEMLDKLPKEIWKDKTKKFLDPCMGLGTFILEIKDRLMENLDSVPIDKREAYIMDNMIYGADTDESKYNMALKLLGTNKDNKHIINKDSLTYDWNMKFDVVVGNPPYQNPGKTKGEKLWYRFIKSGIEILKEGGYFVFLTPNSWMSGGVNTGKWGAYKDVFQKYQLVYANLKNTDKYFKGMGLEIGYWILEKKENYKDSVIVFDDKEISINLKEFEYLSPDSEYLSSIIIKKVLMSGHPKYKGIFTFDKPIEIGSVEEKETYSSEFPYKHWLFGNKSSGNSTFTFLNFRNTPKLEFPKILIKYGTRYWQPYYDDKGIDVAAQGFGIPIENSWTYEGFVSVFESKLYKFINQNLQLDLRGFMKANIFRDLPYLDMSKEWTNEEIYDHFSLNKEEIEYLEKKVK